MSCIGFTRSPLVDPYRDQWAADLRKDTLMVAKNARQSRNARERVADDMIAGIIRADAPADLQLIASVSAGAAADARTGDVAARV
jgi:hypothetical protein